MNLNNQTWKWDDGDHDDTLYGFFDLADVLFVGFALDSRSLSVAAGVKLLDADLGGDLGLADLGVSRAPDFKGAGLEAVPLGRTTGTFLAGIWAGANSEEG